MKVDYLLGIKETNSGHNPTKKISIMKFTWHARYNHSDWMFNALTNHPSDIAQTNGHR